jgi:predicted RNA-binding Zn-ribbon protein involved in translation (DUF1610 family)
MTQRTYIKNAIQTETTFTVVDCPRCGVLHGITTDFETRRRDDGANVYCPNGHVWVYRGGIRERLQAERDQAQRERDEATIALLAERRQRQRAENDLLDKVQAEQRMAKRLHAGVCPQCGRTFAQLRRHMAAKHPQDARDTAEAATDRKPKRGKSPAQE